MATTNIKAILAEQVVADPGLPRLNPTSSYWQSPPHSLASVQGKSLWQLTDFAIIGSGMTGLSVAKKILEHQKFAQSTISVLEARTLCSGATGRNGGGMASPILFYFHHLIEQVGREEAIIFAKFVYKNLEKMHELGSSNDAVQTKSEIRRVRDVAGFRDAETRADIMKSVALLQELVPESNLQMEEITAEEAEEKYHAKGLVSAMLVNAGVNWPYRLITELWSYLLQKYSERLAIETNTAVLSIERDNHNPQYPYLLKTNRGSIWAKHVIHATNGYAGHLLPELRGILVPCRGMMSAHEPDSRFQAVKATSFSNFGKTFYDDKSGVLQGFVYYGHQNPFTGDVFWGGDTDDAVGIYTADDSVVTSTATQDI